MKKSTDTNIKEETLNLNDQIKKWKKEYKYVYRSIIADEEIIWRGLTRKMYLKAMTTIFNENKDLDYYDRQEYIAEQVILYPENKKELIEDFAAIADVISTEALNKAGYSIGNITESL